MPFRCLMGQDARQVAALHAAAINTGFISSMPPSFIQCLYQSIADSPHNFGFVYEENTEILGFICCSTDTKRMFREILWQSGFRFVFLLWRQIFNVSVVKKICNNIFYPNKFKVGLPQAEILSVAVERRAKGKGVGKTLMQMVIAECRKRKILAIKALTDAKNEGSNCYYQKCGFYLVDKVKHHDHYLNIYVLNTSLH